MKFKMRLVTGNGIRPAKIRPEGRFNPLESACKILWPHLKNSWKKSKKGVGSETNTSRQHRRGVKKEFAKKIPGRWDKFSYI